MTEELYLDFLWRVEFDGLALQFNDCSELKETTEVITRKPGGQHHTSKEPGRTNYEPITLTRDGGNNPEMADWRKKVIDAKTLQGGLPAEFKKDIDIVQLNRALDPVARWRLKNAWPSDYAFGPWSGEGTNMVKEVATITYDLATPEEP